MTICAYPPGSIESLQAKAYARKNRKELPENAIPGRVGICLERVNPLDKNTRGVGLNPRQKSEFDGICQVSPEQFLDCYCDVDEAITPSMLAAMCSSCPYSFHKGHCATTLAPTNMSPCFLQERPEIEDIKKPKSYVYLVFDGDFVKIGKATDVAKRLKGIQTGNPKKCAVLAAIPCKSGDHASSLEHYLHTQYAKFRREGEWFDLFGYIDIDAWSRYFDPTLCGVPLSMTYKWETR